jgi:hypothetical protein
MKQQAYVLDIDGLAYPYNLQTIVFEDREAQQRHDALRDAGHKVFAIGNRENGFRLKDIHKILRANPEIETILINAHGNFTWCGHYVQAEPPKRKYRTGRIYAARLYKALARYSKGRPLNVFMFSCGSGNGYVDAVKYLPQGSTMVNLTERGNPYSHKIEPHALNIAVEPGQNFGEELFLSILCKGLDKYLRGLDEHPAHPHLSVSGDTDDPATNIHSLWDMAQRETLTEKTFSTNFKSYVHQRLNRHASRQDINTAFATIELVSSYHAGPPVLKKKGTPVTLPLDMDSHLLHRDAARHEIMGVMCAIAYLASREKIGAFQIWESDEYTSPTSHRPNKRLSRRFRSKDARI